MRQREGGGGRSPAASRTLPDSTVRSSRPSRRRRSLPAYHRRGPRICSVEWENNSVPGPRHRRCSDANRRGDQLLGRARATRCGSRRRRVRHGRHSRGRGGVQAAARAISPCPRAVERPAIACTIRGRLASRHRGSPRSRNGYVVAQPSAAPSRRRRPTPRGARLARASARYRRLQRATLKPSNFFAPRIALAVLALSTAAACGSSAAIVSNPKALSRSQTRRDISDLARRS